MKRKLAIAGCLAAVMLLTAGCRKNTNSTNSQETVPAPQSIPPVVGTQEADVFSIETSFGAMKFPVRWQEQVTVNRESENHFRFLHKPTNTQLFDVFIGGEDGAQLGFVTSGGEQIPIRIHMYDIDTAAEAFETCFAIQEDVNVMLHYLSEEYQFAFLSADAAASGSTAAETEAAEQPLQTESAQPEETQPVETEPAVYEIRTSVATLRYPEKWADVVVVDITEGDSVIVGFRVKNTSIKLFDLILGESEDYLLGVMQTGAGEMPVRIKSYPLNENDYNFDIYCEIQESLNTVIECLVSDYGFKYMEK